MTNQELPSCWEFNGCNPDKVNCPAVPAQKNDIFCFEVASRFCSRTKEVITKKDTFEACIECEYFDMVKSNLPTGETTKLLLKAKTADMGLDNLCEVIIQTEILEQQIERELVFNVREVGHLLGCLRDLVTNAKIEISKLIDAQP